MKKALVIASVASMIDQFNIPNILLLKELGYEVNVACNFLAGSTCSQAKVESLKKYLEEINIKSYQIDFARNVSRLYQNLKAYYQVKKIVDSNHYDLIHCHSPIGGMLTRLAARKSRKKGTRVLYTAHGFHFNKDMPMWNWIAYYPVEYICSYYTDILISINKEDYSLAQNRLHSKEVVYVPGVGIDIKQYSISEYDSNTISKVKKSLGIGNDEKMIISIGELISGKNHESVIKALSKLSNTNWKYFICGKGKLYDSLQKLINELGLANSVQLLGFRTDIKELLTSADLFVLPSFREGLPVALMEAMVSKTAAVCSNIRGNTDLIGKNALFNPCDIESIAIKIDEYLKKDNTDEILLNYEKVKDFDINIVMAKMKALYTTKE